MDEDAELILCLRQKPGAEGGGEMPGHNCPPSNWDWLL